MDEFLITWANALPGLVPWELLGRIIPAARIDRRAVARLNAWNTLGQAILPAKIYRSGIDIPVIGYLSIEPAGVVFALDEALVLERTQLTRSADGDDEVVWGDFTGPTLWAAGSLMKLERQRTVECLGDWKSIQVPPVWTLVVAHGLEVAGFDVRGEWQYERRRQAK